MRYVAQSNRYTHLGHLYSRRLEDLTSCTEQIYFCLEKRLGWLELILTCPTDMKIIQEKIVTKFDKYILILKLKLLNMFVWIRF